MRLGCCCGERMHDRRERRTHRTGLPSCRSEIAEVSRRFAEVCGDLRRFSGVCGGFAEVCEGFAEVCERVVEVWAAFAEVCGGFAISRRATLSSRKRCGFCLHDGLQIRRGGCEGRCAFRSC